ncbi:hypothetical protein [Aquimarina sp. RZ0]|uniref:hypothetical protein n=1 Tax=Aquimarina sp. RZ0 TaxID=2607730 RepID=UPI0011F3B808|nr:hypothetical protein [Aquimarina sp. RZ0]KAA1245010.1 hypothetical protein F0000_14140 [Aquimarina sp. RZ0]
MPFNRNKWALIFEPTYNNFKSEAELANQTVRVDYKSIEFHTGTRYYLFINKNSKAFLNGLFIFDLDNDSEIEFEYGGNLKIKSKNNLALGLGYKFKDRYSAKLRYQTSREVLGNL